MLLYALAPYALPTAISTPLLTLETWKPIKAVSDSKQCELPIQEQLVWWILVPVAIDKGWFVYVWKHDFVA